MEKLVTCYYERNVNGFNKCFTNIARGDTRLEPLRAKGVRLMSDEDTSDKQDMDYIVELYEGMFRCNNRICLKCIERSKTRGGGDISTDGEEQ